MPSLTRVEAAQRAATLSVESYEIDLDLTAAGDTFASVVTIQFRASAGAETFVEVKPVELQGVRLNGVELDPAALAGNRYPLTGLAERNTLTVGAVMAYTNTGQGLHRVLDPADGATYLYATSFLDDAQRIFAAFDQPDLKAPVTLRVAAPPDWLVAANGAVAARPGPGRWEFARTEPLATYFVSLIAGSYHVRRDEHDGVPLALYCRRSLAEHLDADAEEIFTVTRQCLDEFHRLFGVRYPFGKYDQAFVPEFNEGAMENPGLVTIRDDYVFRSAVTDSDREQRATTISHEMAHMWFGDLVTMRWWDDLWLNESFAEYLGTRVTAEATRFDRAWAKFAMRRKNWGYAADQRPSTHPVAPADVADTAQALVNFDGISYAKGASVLRQLVAWVGDEAFLAGLRAHFAAHRFGNATLADLLGSLDRATGAGGPVDPADDGRDLGAWAEPWLRRAGVNTLRVEATPTPDGRYAEVAVVQTAPADQPVLRPHRIALGLYDPVEQDGPVAHDPAERPDPVPGATRLRRRVEVDLDPAAPGGRTVVAALAGEPVARLLLPNDGDLTFAKVRLDAASAAAVPQVLPTLADPLARALVWSAVMDAVRDAERPVTDLVPLLSVTLPGETEVVLVEEVFQLARPLFDRYLDPPARRRALDTVAAAWTAVLAPAGGGAGGTGGAGGLDGAVGTGGSTLLAAVHGLIWATADSGLLHGWLAGDGLPEGLVLDADLRWALLERLVVLGAADETRIAAESARDRTAAGEQRAAYCRAALPDEAAKERAWRLVVADTAASMRALTATATGFWHPEQVELTSGYVERYFAELPAMASCRTPWAAETIAHSLFPRYAVAPRTRELAADLLAGADLPPGVRRAVLDADDDLRRALAAR
ncbi:aminopeptidase N [Plantactinospora sp. KBS50]|uniref:aminopeptidase N n=1 Tax=Plantactinospora sp. KBS50 TaxID=2024580 RepID=UPI000BAABDC7|nr:aminopeptidase N [Plantactinospora sp. KBS50]ASW56274.1 aminopeptidase N [Plantactinospora sp. KBS50]